MRSRLPPLESRLENFCVSKIDMYMYLEKKNNRAINFLSPRLETQTTRLETQKTRLEMFASFEDRGSSRVVRVSSDCQLTFDQHCMSDNVVSH